MTFEGGRHALLKAGSARLFALPERALAVLAGPPRIGDRGVALDPALALLVRLADGLGFPKTSDLTPEAARAQTANDAALVSPPARPPARIEDRHIPGPAGRMMRIRAYVPERGRALPVIVYLHGGGFVIGGIETHDGVCRRIAQMSRSIVVSVDYRLAPEHRYPKAVDDAEAAFRWIAARADRLGGDPARVGIAGDSAGGNLAAVVCRRLRDTDAPVRPKAQLLIYPATDMTMSHPSIATFARGFYLERTTIDWFLDRYLEHREREAREVDASPLFVDDLAGLPPAVVVTAGFDPLRDEGDAYAARLADANVPVAHTCEATMLHGFASMAGVSRPALAALDEMSRRMGALLA